MNDSGGMQMFKPDDYLCDVLLRPLFCQTTKVLDESSTISTVEVLHDEVEVIFRLESVVQFDDKVGFGRCHENHSFRFDVRDLILRNHIRLLQHLDRVVISGCNLLRQINGPN